MQERLPNGPAAAAILSAGLGSAVIGLLTTGAVISTGLKSALNWWGPAGPLVTLVLLALGVLLTFPPVFEAFE